MKKVAVGVFPRQLARSLARSLTPARVASIRCSAHLLLARVAFFTNCSARSLADCLIYQKRPRPGDPPRRVHGGGVVPAPAVGRRRGAHPRRYRPGRPPGAPGLVAHPPARPVSRPACLLVVLVVVVVEEEEEEEEAWQLLLLLLSLLLFCCLPLV